MNFYLNPDGPAMISLLRIQDLFCYQSQDMDEHQVLIQVEREPYKSTKLSEPKLLLSGSPKPS